MALYEWIESMRKKPIAERRRFAAVTTIVVMAVITAVWFLFFFLTLGDRIKAIGDEASSTEKVVISLPSIQIPSLSNFNNLLRAVIEQSASSTPTTTPETASSTETTP